MVLRADWSRARCAQLVNDAKTQEEKTRILGLFFVEDDDDVETTKTKQNEAKAICTLCPIKRDCLSVALAQEDRFGVWGGADESQLRKALSVDQYGHPTIRLRDMKCPNCNSKKLMKPLNLHTKTKIKCTDCLLVWWARKKPDIVHVNADEEGRNDDLG